MDKKGQKHWFRNTLIIICTAILVYNVVMNVPDFYDVIGKRFEGFFALFGGGGPVDSSTSQRMSMINAALDRWLLNPVVGYGFDSFKFYNQAEVTGYFYYSHNNMLELLHNQGIIGFVAYYGFYVFLLVKALRSNSKELYKGFTVAIVISLLLYEFFGVTYCETPMQFMLFFAWFCLEQCTESEKEQPQIVQA
jgi:O-antigen ligase